jgi:hypothetical protein
MEGLVAKALEGMTQMKYSFSLLEEGKRTGCSKEEVVQSDMINGQAL